MNTFIALLTAFGLGSIVSALIQARVTLWSKDNDRRFEEKQKAFIGLLEAYHKAAVEGTDEAGKEFAYWQLRCELVASHDVCKAISEIVKTNDDRPARFIAHEELKKSMRADLGIATK